MTGKQEVKAKATRKPRKKAEPTKAAAAASKVAAAAAITASTPPHALPDPSPVQHMTARADLAAFLARSKRSLDDDAKTLILLLLKDGATLAEIVRIPGFATFGSIAAARRLDAAWDAEVQAALTEGAAAMLAQAQTYATESLSTLDIDRMRMADILSKITALYAEKMAPRAFGQLVKLAGDESMAPVTISVINYARQSVDGTADTQSTRTHASNGPTRPALAHDVAQATDDQGDTALDGI